MQTKEQVREEYFTILVQFGLQLFSSILNCISGNTCTGLEYKQTFEALAGNVRQVSVLRGKTSWVLITFCSNSYSQCATKILLR
jgi:hypothetical protein